ncbi:uncharacterized protein LOC107762682 [Nicotiana tabacum]|uniref:Uncharacterized protein LOC107762682 n=1 Tax=Nicotiana tabacum TaxID=4097 RepID=A0A1S3X9F9_TOBAC|nr:uncharacterized protein LOC104114801 [Nicotiana tomentosiformis]XP_016436542.1 PREDICTED: uncharacterized protein LOC107762682 [Nicotiana tabacum]
MSKIDNSAVLSICKTVLVCGLVLYVGTIIFFNDSQCPSSDLFFPLKLTISPSNSQTNTLSNDAKTNNATNISHLLFGLLGSEKAWHHRISYVESWWRPNITKGYLLLDFPPKGDLLPWSINSPPYKISDDVPKLVEETKHVDPTVLRLVHGIMEVFREEHEGLRWLVMGDDDSVFFVDNMVDILAQYDHTKYYYFGGHSEFILSNYWYSFNQGFGGAGFILSYPLAKALANNMMSCLKRYAHLKAADRTTMTCIADIGVNLSPLQGIHQIDLRGDLSGFLSSHPKSLLMSLHHFDMVEPIFPSLDRAHSGFHLLNAANYDQSRMLQQTICHKRSSNWTFSVSWGYSAHIYEKIMPRSWIQNPIETFKTWNKSPRPPHYMFDVRSPSLDPCEAPHVFFFKSVERNPRNEIVTIYTRGWPRGIGACLSSGNYSAEYVSEIHVYSPATKRIEIDRCECCDVIHEAGSNKAEIKYRECLIDEIIA